VSCHSSTDGSITICRPDFTGQKVRVLWCPKCKQKRRVVQRFYESYDSAFGIARCEGLRRKWAHMEKCGYKWRWGNEEAL